MDDRERTRREIVVQDYLADEEIRDLAFDMAQRARESDDPAILDMDLCASEKYARACFQRMSFQEFRRLTPRTVASLWARGALGAARYRRAHRKKG